jgi:hypothetical protein
LVTGDILAYPLSRARLRSSEERRRLVIRDTIAWAIVALIHIVALSSLVISLRQNYERLGRRNGVETVLDLTLLHRNNAPPLAVIQPDVQDQKDKDLSAKPLTVIPPTPPMIAILPPPPSVGDLLGAVGQFLACGASSFEYLNPAQQARCPRQPWQGLQLPNGTIVLNPLPRQLLETGTQPSFTGAEALTRQMRQNSGCPIMLNGPCLEDMFTGNNSRAPGIPDPH